jgi:hypothetical protein
MSKSEAMTAITPDIGASQNTIGELMTVIVAKACKGMNMLKNPCRYCLYIFPKISSKVLYKRVINMRSKFYLVFARWLHF